MSVRKRYVKDINVVPYIDVMLVLLVIFMVTAPMVQQGVVVDLPQTKGTMVSENSRVPMVVTVARDGVYYLNIADTPLEPIEPRALLVRLVAEQRRAPERRILVRGDAHAEYTHIVGLVALLESSGAKQVGLITKPVGDK